jgi:NAD(P)-dependent dehydrogenase (short-subunit alcohol dehydrogenase family)
MAELDGKTIVVTGATSGIGFEAAIDLARRGADVVLVGRDAARTDAAVAAVKARSGAQKVTRFLCDFGSQAAIRRLAAEIRASHDRIDVLLNNAGGVYPERVLTEDGIESTFAVNHLGPFLLTHLLLDLVVKSAPARIINVASTGHRGGTMDFEDLNFDKGYFIMKAYARSKLGNVLFTRELARRLRGQGVTVNCLHPGAVATGIWAKAPRWTQPLLSLIGKFAFITAEQGGQTLVYLATSPEVANITGEYFTKNKVVPTSPLGSDMALAAKLWDVSAKLVKVAPA